jgi:hypothetical protein
MARSLRFALVGGLMLSVALGCGGGTPTATDTPTPGPLTLTLAAPSSDVGALMFTISGAQLQRFTPAAGLTAYATPGGQSWMKIVIVGPIGSGPVGQVQVPDTRKVASYSVSILQAASGISYALQSLPGYTIGLSR